MFGEWACESKLVAFSLPKGAEVAPREAAAVAKLELGRVVPFTSRFYSTLPDSFANALRVNLGAVPQQKVIADRAFNRANYTNAVLGCVQHFPRESSSLFSPVSHLATRG